MRAKRRITTSFIGIFILITSSYIYVKEDESEAMGGEFIPQDYILRARLTFGFLSPNEKPNGSPVIMELFNGTYMDPIRFADVLLDYGADINGSAPSGETSLHRAVHASLTNEIPYLLRHGADPNREDNSGATPLFSLSSDTYAQNESRGIIVRLLLEGGADPCHRNHAGKTAADVYGPKDSATPIIAEACRTSSH